MLHYLHYIITSFSNTLVFNILYLLCIIIKLNNYFFKFLEKYRNIIVIFKSYYILETILLLFNLL